MEAQTMHKIRWFWAWQDDQEEAWLEYMSRQGWHLKRVAPLSYTFEKGAPRDYAYRLDFQADKNLAEYIEFIQSAGWQHIGNMVGWQYFRRPVEGGQGAELFTDPESKIEKHKRFLKTTVVASPVWMVVFFAHLDRYPLWFAILFVALFLTLIAFYTVTLVKVQGRINRLKRL